jgi:hypothetical protein
VEITQKIWMTGKECAFLATGKKIKQDGITETDLRREIHHTINTWFLLNARNAS